MFTFTNSIDNPENLEVIIGSGQSGEFILREDFTGKEKTEEGVATRLAYNHRTKQFTIHAAEGNLEAIPNKRSWKLKVYGVKIDKVIMTVNDDDHEVKGFVK